MRMPRSGHTAVPARPSGTIRKPLTCLRRDGRVAEGARLESVYTLTGIVGSNPTLSASLPEFLQLRPTHTAVHTVRHKATFKEAYGQHRSVPKSTCESNEVRAHQRRSMALLSCAGRW